MFLLKKEFSFEASHILPFHDGKCRRLHGHSWKMIVWVRGESLIQDGPHQAMVLDYADIAKVVRPLIDNHLDHWHLNDSLELSSPTSEAVAQWIFEKLQPKLNGLEAVS